MRISERGKRGEHIRDLFWAYGEKGGIAYGWEFTDTINTELSGSCIIRRQISGVTGASRRIYGQYL
jgi:hypothetical protein